MQEHPKKSSINFKRATAAYEHFKEIDRAKEIFSASKVSRIRRETRPAGGRIVVIEAISSKMPTNAFFSTLLDPVRAKEERIRSDLKNPGFLKACFV